MAAGWSGTGGHPVGGVKQYYIPNGLLPWINNDSTGWWKKATAAHVQIKKPQLKIGPPSKGAVADASHFLALEKLVDYLARLLQAAGDEGTQFRVRTEPFSGQAANLKAKAGVLQAHAGYLPDPAAKARSKLIAQSLVPIARYLDGDIGSSSYAQEINSAIDAVVKWAYAIGVEAT